MNNIIFINEINFLISDFLKTINKDDIKIYFMNNKINENDNFNKWIYKNITDEQINFLKSNVNYSIECLKKINTNLVNKNSNLNYDLWKLCIFDNMFFNLPFTLEDVIFIPISYINSSMNNLGLVDSLFNNKINKSFSKTLIHEKLHLLQRFNQDIWNKYIIENTNWRIVNKNIFFNSTFINNNFIIYNPDTFYVIEKFVYDDNEKLYFGQMLLNSKNEIKNIWYEIKELSDKINIYPTYVFNKKYEHPYEELAYNMANDLSNN